MNTLSRLTIAASIAAVAAVACTSVAEPPSSVHVDTDQVGARCIKGGITCGVTGASSGSVGGFGSSGTFVADPTTSSSSGGTSGKLGSSGHFTSGGVLDPTPDVDLESPTCGTNTAAPPPGNARTTGGCNPIDCGEHCQWDKEKYGCECIGAGYGLSSTITCPALHPCGRSVRGVVRCYDYLPGSEECAP